jgi:hypothetical protein
MMTTPAIMLENLILQANSILPNAEAASLLEGRISIKPENIKLKK